MKKALVVGRHPFNEMDYAQYCNVHEFEQENHTFGFAEEVYDFLNVRVL